MEQAFLDSAMQTEAVTELNTINDWLRWTTSQFAASGIFFGHGSDNPWDEAVQLIMPALSLPVDAPKELATSKLTTSEKETLVALIAARINERVPVAYLTNEELTVYFDFDKSSINTNEVVKLNNLIKALIASEGVESLSIVGYADRIGNAKANQRLSEKRTAAVQNYLNDKVNIPTEILKSAAKGEDNPVTDCKKNQKRNSLISCLAADRRVEIVLNYYKF